jgi:hypothetical protein
VEVQRALPAGAGAGGPVGPCLQQSVLFRIYDGVPITWSIDQCEQMSSIVLGDLATEELRLDFFSLEALDRFVIAAKQARRRLTMRIKATEEAIAAGYAG